VQFGFDRPVTCNELFFIGIINEATRETLMSTAYTCDANFNDNAVTGAQLSVCSLCVLTWGLAVGGR
jgi:hypothetical protein